eukprot:CAMPEP_0119261344 /NCGR_PEP_ID=MMETSP1329-20130426/1440_1 /TAXON_ID=114041 /ORGANISM="Genus nov. species nov., Strain RCC1024" /LENGTH=345 /DNA_ID=CAMNT_0007260897 /DNA_START=103 /DNA_END=1137 /DNA_ORIENTATION=-
MSAASVDAAPAAPEHPEVSPTSDANATSADAPAASAAAADASDPPLTQQDLAQFERDGFCVLRGAFQRGDALECRAALWRHLEETRGIAEGDRSTWSKAPKGRQGLQDMFAGSDLGAPWAACWSPRLRRALDQLCGEGRWVEDGLGCGWWVVTFPGVAEGPWGAEGSWHVDGHGYVHKPDSEEIGCLPIFLFSDVLEAGGGTALAPGSHRHVAELLWRAGARGVEGPRLSALAREALDESSIVECRGRAGDVVLTHPFLLHARSKNLRPAAPENVRFMCHPAVRLKEPMRVREDGGAATPVEAPIIQARRLLGGDVRPLPKRGRDPEEAALQAALGFAGFGGRKK